MVLATGCGDDAEPEGCQFDLAFAAGGDGHAEPLGAGPGEARAGRIEVSELPASASELLTWAPGDFVLANDKVAMVIEDVGPSDLYDPWGGRPVGMAMVRDGALHLPADFGEFFILAGRYTVVTESVSVVNDGSDGNAAVIRASGFMAPLPFFENITAGLLRDEFDDMRAAIEYVLEPDAEHVDIHLIFHSPREHAAMVNAVLHAFMYGKRTPAWAPGKGFGAEARPVPYYVFVDDDATSWAYENPHGELGAGVSASGFSSNITDAYELAACGETRRHHARITIGGPGLEGVRRVLARASGESTREITGVVRDASGNPAGGVRVHAETPEQEHITRVKTDENGVYSLTVPAGQDVDLTAYRRGDAVVGPVRVAASVPTMDIDLAPTGIISVTATDLETGTALPVRIQVMPGAGSAVATVPARYGEPEVTGGREHVEYAMNGQASMRVPAGEWDVVVSRGYEWELYRETVTVGAGGTASVNAVLERAVDTTGIMCADYHIHTIRSNDSGDDSYIKVMSAAADGLDIAIRSDHEFVDGFAREIAALGLEDWVFGTASVELSSMEIWGHMGVLPLTPDPTKVNNGTPLWQRFPMPGDTERTIETLNPVDVFNAVRARPEQPVVIINHPRGTNNYFDYAGYDPESGMAAWPDVWDEAFKVVEVFNDSSWSMTSKVVIDWLSFLNHGRRVFAVGSSDSHAISGSPVGYPRTCLEVGTDDPRSLTKEIVRDTTAAGHSIVTGGIYLDVRVGGAGPGDDATGVGEMATVSIKVQAASWIDVDRLEVVVDGVLVQTIDIPPEDADPIRYDKTITVPVAATGSYLIVAAVGDSSLEPVHPGRRPFGVTNPIFLTR